jgi:threonine/homoserine/homoserine lactone efflux protein
VSKQLQNVLTIGLIIVLLIGEAVLYALADSLSSRMRGAVATVGIVIIAIAAVWWMIRSVK